MVTLENLLKSINEKFSFPYKDFGTYWGLDVTISRGEDESRSQKVYVMKENDKGSGKEIFFAWSYIGEYHKNMNLESFLRRNMWGIYSRIAIQNVASENKDYLVVCGATIAESCNEDELVAVMQEVSIAADGLEMEIFGVDNE
jgi:hypothetical protein